VIPLKKKQYRGLIDNLGGDTIYWILNWIFQVIYSELYNEVDVLFLSLYV